MTQYDAFLQAIIANLEDDAPRLIYADWLEEHGESERAEFVRLQCKLANGCKVCDGTGRNVVSPCPCSILRHRERKLLAKHKNNWLPAEVAEAAIFGSASPEQVASGLRWTRCFVSEITLRFQDWLTHREQLLKAVPLEKVTRTNLPLEASRDYSAVIFRDRPFQIVANDGHIVDPPAAEGFLRRYIVSNFSS